jgi:D-alanyl-D-alanine dipeptidase
MVSDCNDSTVAAQEASKMPTDKRVNDLIQTMRLLLATLLGAGLMSCGTPKATTHHLVDVETLPRPPKLDVRYATKANFTHQRLYPRAKVFLHRDAAQALVAVQTDLAHDGLRLKIFDGYRPLSVQQRMWDLIRDERYVSNPAVNRGRHTRGTAVDVTLVDSSGRDLPMGTDYDDFSEMAHPDFAGLPERVKRNRARLAAAMTRHGFEAYPFEWWHFDLKGWKRYPVLDVGIDVLVKR